MKQSGTCPKCGGTDLLRIFGTITDRSDGNRPPIVVSGIWVPRAHRNVCCPCGYSEEWVDPRDLPALKKEFGPPNHA